MKTALKMLTGLVWLVRGKQVPRTYREYRPSTDASSRAASLRAAVAHHRRAAAKCAAAGDAEGRALHEKHAERYAAELVPLEGVTLGESG